jgi:hypothetical protein
MDFHVGSPQRPENKHWCGFQGDAFGYNERPTSSCQTFCWKARHLFDAPFFYRDPGHRAAMPIRQMSVVRGGFAAAPSALAERALPL